MARQAAGMGVPAGVLFEYGREAERNETTLRAQDRPAGREEAFASLVARHSRVMFRVAYALLRNSHDAEDAVQEALLKLYRGDAWCQMQDEKAFLARSVWRVALGRLPRKGMDDVTALELAASGSSPEQNALDGDERATLRLLIDALPQELRQVLLLSAIEEMGSREVGLAMGIPEGTVRTRLMRAKAELKKRYEAMQEVRR